MPATSPAARVGLVLALAGSLAACDEFATPAELAATQVLAIRVEPPAVSPGESAELEILVADQDGPLAAPDVTWEMTSAIPGEPPLGAIETLDAGRARYTAPASVAEMPALGSVLATVHVDPADPSRDLQAIKGVVIADLPLVNPTVTALFVGGQDALAGDVLAVASGQLLPVEMTTDPAATDDGIFAWYATVGEIERYQSNPTELATGDAPGTGWLIGVMRDGRGGVVWQAIQLDVQ